MKPNNRYKFIQPILVALLLGSSFALAYQTNDNPQISEKRIQQMKEGQSLLDQYMADRNSVKIKNLFLSDAETFLAIQSKGLPKTGKNVDTIRSLLAANSKKDEKIALQRLLGSLYSHDNQSGANHLIQQDLRLQINSNEKDIAIAALLSFSRLGYFSDSAEVLKRAYDKKILSDTGYFGELAHLLPYAPAADQNKLLDTIRAGKNAYARDILTSSFTQASIIKKLHPATKKNLRHYFDKNQPNFTMAIGEYGVIDSFRYTNWLQSSTMLDIDITGKTYQELIFKHLNDPNLDPRKIMAYLSATEGKYLIDHLQNAKQKEDIKALYERVKLYSTLLPQNSIMKDLVQQIALNMESLKK